MGIDLGTCSTRAAWREQGEVHFVRNPIHGALNHPTGGYCSGDGPILVGECAEAMRDRDPANYWGEFKRDLGSDNHRLLGNRLFQAEELAVALLKQLREQAEQTSNCTFTKAVLTVPATFQSYRRQRLEQVAGQAGFEQVDLLTEPEAAALYLERRGRLSLPEGGRLLVYDLGGGTFDAALFQQTQGRLELLAGPVGASDLGGREFDGALLNEILLAHPLLDEQMRRPTVEARRLLHSLEDSCREHGKHVLSARDDAEIPLPPTLASVHRVTRCEFRDLVKDLLDRTVELCRDLFGRKGPEQEATIVLVGGTCRLPLVAEALQAAFPQAKVIRASDPDLIVCLGAVQRAAELDDAEREAAGTPSGARVAGPYRVRRLWESN